VIASASERRRGETWIAGGLALLAFLTVAAVAPVLDARAAASTFYDDAFYYFQIARSVAGGAGFSFDGVHATSGFHPLWLFLLIPVFWLVPGDVAPLRAVLLLEAALVAAAAATVFRALLPRVGRVVAVIAALLLIAQPGAPRLLRAGMEGALAVWLLAMAWSRWLDLRDDTQAPLRCWWRLGSWCALFFLARLEGAVAVPILAALAWPRLREDRRRGLALAAPLALVATVYVAWTVAAFGTWGPVSALAKTRLGGDAWTPPATARQGLTRFLYLPWGVEPHVRRLLAALHSDPELAPAVGTLVVLALVAVVLWKRRRARPRPRELGFVFVAATALAMMLIDKASVRLMVDWYRAPALLALALLGAILVEGHPRLARASVVALSVVGLLRVPQPLWPLRVEADREPEGLQAAQWLRPRLAAGALAAGWNSGLVGYFAGGRVVNLDGLANDAAFLREVVRGRDLAGYLDREDVRYLVDATSQGRLAPLVRRYPRAVAEAVEARYAAVASFQGACGPDASPCPPLTVWERKDEAR
jgi:hypothetical protein